MNLKLWRAAPLTASLTRAAALSRGCRRYLQQVVLFVFLLHFLHATLQLSETALYILKTTLNAALH